MLPVYDYVLVTEPLSAAQLDALRWRHRQGVGDSGNRFHYYRLTHDNRILWGGYDAIYHFGNGFGPQLEQRPETFNVLAEHFAETFPQLAEGVRFSHRWGGAIDTCSRFSVMFGRALEGRAVYAVGFTGLGVGASRFAGRVALDLVAGETTERTAPGDGPQAPGPVPARAAALGRGQPHPPRARPRRPAWRAARPVAAHARPARARVRLLSGRPCGSRGPEREDRAIIARRGAPRA